MKVRDLILKLGELRGELPVCLADWAEGYAKPSEGQAEIVRLVKAGLYYPTIGTGTPVLGDFVCIGDD